MRGIRMTLLFLLVSMTCLRPAHAEEPTLLDTIALIAAQNKLYELNYNPGNYMGVYDEATRDAVRKWQSVMGFSVTGELDPIQYMALMIADSSGAWGSVGICEDGTYASAIGMPTRQQASENALSQVRSRSSDPSRCVAGTVPQSADGNTWMGGMHCKRSDGAQYGFALARPSDDTLTPAMREHAVSQGFAVTDCTLLIAITSHQGHDYVKNQSF